LTQTTRSILGLLTTQLHKTIELITKNREKSYSQRIDLLLNALNWPLSAPDKSNKGAKAPRSGSRDCEVINFCRAGPTAHQLKDADNNGIVVDNLLTYLII